MKNKLTYFLSRSSMFGIGFYLIFKETSKDSWISLLLGTLLGIIIIYIFSLIKKYINNKTIIDSLKNYSLGKLYIFIFILFNLFLITTTLVILPLFVNSFYLTHTPKLVVNIPFLLLAIYLTFKDKKVLENLSNLLCVFSIIIILSFAFFLTKYISFNELLPIFTVKTTSILKSALTFGIITSVPTILTLNYSYDFKTSILDYLLGVGTLFIILFFTIISLGKPLIEIYSFPEYAVLKKINILNFIENIENISSFIWYFDMFMMLAINVRNLKDSLPKKFNKLSLVILLFISLILASLVIGDDYSIILLFVKYYPYILLGFFLLFVTLLIYLKIKKNVHN